MKEDQKKKKLIIKKNVCFGFTCLTFFFFLRKKLHEWKKNLYTVSVKLSYLFQFLAHTPYKLELSVVHGCIQTPKSHAVDPLVWSTSSFLSKRTLSYCILTEDFVCPYVTMKYLYHLLSQESKPVWFGNLLLSKWNRDAVLNFPWCL